MIHPNLLTCALLLFLICKVFSDTPQAPRPRQYFIDYSLIVDRYCPPTQPTKTHAWVDISDESYLKYRTRTFGVSCEPTLKYAFIDYYFYLTLNSSSGFYSMQPYVVIEDAICFKPSVQNLFPTENIADVFSCTSQYVGMNYSTVAKKQCQVFEGSGAYCQPNGNPFFVYVDPDTRDPVEFVDGYQLSRPVNEYKVGADSVKGAFSHPPDFLCKSFSAFEEKYQSASEPILGFLARFSKAFALSK